MSRGGRVRPQSQWNQYGQPTQATPIVAVPPTPRSNPEPHLRRRRRHRPRSCPLRSTAVRHSTRRSTSISASPRGVTALSRAAYDPDEGAFRFTCGGEGRLAYERPVMFPSQPGKSHLHQPWGNRRSSREPYADKLAAWPTPTATMAPTRSIARATGMPALVNDQGQVIHPDLVSVYYKRNARGLQAFCTPGTATMPGICVGLPNQIRSSSGGIPAIRPPRCKAQAGTARPATASTTPTSMTCSTPAASRTANRRSIANTLAPNCWDGVASRCRRSPQPHGLRQLWHWGYYKCPADHPYCDPAGRKQGDVDGDRRHDRHESGRHALLAYSLLERPHAARRQARANTSR